MAFDAAPPDPRRIDAVDRKLLGLLQENAQMKYAELGERLNLSAPAIHDRVKKLKAAGVLRGYTIAVDSAALGYGLCALVSVHLWRCNCKDVVPHLMHHPEIEECHSVAGQSCIILKVRTENTKTLETMLNALRRIEGVENTETTVILSTHIERPSRV